MKKCFLILGLVLALCMVISTPVSAAVYDREKIDSEDISEEYRQEIGAEAGDTVLRIYGVRSVAFAFCDNLEAVLQSKYFQNNQCCVYSGDTFVKEMTYTEDGWQVRELPAFDDWRLLEKFYDDTIIQSVSEDIEVYHKYLLYGGYHGSVYYETNMGDYVLYHHYNTDEDGLFALDVFCQYQLELFEYNVEKYSQYVNGGEETPDPWDLSSYDYRSAKFNPNAPLTLKSENTFPWVYVLAGGAIVLVGALGAVILLRRKKAA